MAGRVMQTLAARYAITAITASSCTAPSVHAPVGLRGLSRARLWLSRGSVVTGSIGIFDSTCPPGSTIHDPRSCRSPVPLK